MSRRRWVYRQNEETGRVEAVEVGTEHQPAARIEFSMDRHYEGLRATDGTDIGSRRKHQEYMRLNGLTTADDYKETWAKAAERRAQFFNGGGDAAEHKARQETIGRVMYELERKGRK